MFSQRHLTPGAKRQRTSNSFLTLVNLIKVCIGISFLSVSVGISQAGIYGAFVGSIYVLIVNVFAQYLIVKARNRFKKDETIFDICDLGAKLYGEGLRPFLTILLVANNFTFLMAYVMYFGTQSDKISCRSIKARECGYSKYYSALIVLILLPLILCRRLTNIGVFSAVILIFSIVSIGIIIYLLCVIVNMSPKEVEETYHVKLTDEDREVKEIDYLFVPIFIGAFFNVFEGNA